MFGTSICYLVFRYFSPLAGLPRAVKVNGVHSTERNIAVGVNGIHYNNTHCMYASLGETHHILYTNTQEQVRSFVLEVLFCAWKMHALDPGVRGQRNRVGSNSGWARHGVSPALPARGRVATKSNRSGDVFVSRRASLEGARQAHKQLGSRSSSIIFVRCLYTPPGIIDSVWSLAHNFSQSRLTDEVYRAPQVTRLRNFSVLPQPYPYLNTHRKTKARH